MIIEIRKKPKTRSFKKIGIGWVVFALILGVFSTSWAATPATITVQAVFKDTTGTPLSGLHKITVGIYEGSTLKWQETFNKTLSKGVFSEVLGKSTPITTSNLDLSVAKLGFSVNDAAPDFVELTAVPYALQARFSETAITASIAERIPTASSSTLGGIKIGSGLRIDELGVVSATGNSEQNFTTVLKSKLDSLPSTINAGTGLSFNGTTFSINGQVVTSNFSSGVSVNGTVSANYFAGDGSLLRNIPAGTPADDSVTSEKIVNNTISNVDIASNAAIANTKLDSFVVTSNYNASVSVNGQLKAADVTVNGTVSANRFIGDGSSLSGIASSSSWANWTPTFYNGAGSAYSTTNVVANTARYKTMGGNICFYNIKFTIGTGFDSDVVRFSLPSTPLYSVSASGSTDDGSASAVVPIGVSKVSGASQLIVQHPAGVGSGKFNVNDVVYVTGFYEY
ncbi:hypothetical protein EBR96_00735 [bacterium]|nr:hypothetical protein [bacterium]